MMNEGDFASAPWLPVLHVSVLDPSDGLHALWYEGLFSKYLGPLPF